MRLPTFAHRLDVAGVASGQPVKAGQHSHGGHSVFGFYGVDPRLKGVVSVGGQVVGKLDHRKIVA